MRTSSLLFLALVGCVIDDRLPLDVPIVAGGTGIVTLPSADGGTVTLESAAITFTDLRLEEPAGTDLASVLTAISPFGTAYAHPGHDYPGDVAGELLGTFTVDLLGPDAELGLAGCYEGAFSTGRVSVSGTVAVLAGSHTDAAGGVRPFRFAVEADEDIIGIPFEALLVAGNPPDHVALRFDLANALRFVDWSAPDTDGDGVLTVADDVYGNTALFGVVATPTWSLTLVP